VLGDESENALAGAQLEVLRRDVAVLALGRPDKHHTSVT